MAESCLAILLLLAAVDLRHHLLPKRLCYLLILSTFLAAAIDTALLSSVTIAAAIFFVYLAMSRIVRGGFGYGDIRLAPSIQIQNSIFDSAALHLLSWVIAGLFILLMVCANRQIQGRIPFAPYFFVASLISQPF